MYARSRQLAYATKTKRNDQVKILVVDAITSIAYYVDMERNDNERTPRDDESYGAYIMRMKRMMDRSKSVDMHANAMVARMRSANEDIERERSHKHECGHDTRCHGAHSRRTSWMA